jgi:hypothetical protein
VRCYCPRCREGKMFTHKVSLSLKKNMQMNANCPVCGQPTDIEVGFYYGTGYVSYLVGIGISVLSFFLWWLTIGFSLNDNRFFFWILFNGLLLIVLQPWLMRFARSLWLSFFVSYDPDWEHHAPLDPERVNDEQKNNW